MEYITFKSTRETLDKIKHITVDWVNKVPLTDSINEMLTVSHKRGAIGGASNQFGVDNIRFLFIHDVPNNILMFNPKVTWESELTDVAEEGSLTYPGFTVEVRRPRQIRVRYTNIAGMPAVDKYVGHQARAIMHYIDHLDGKFFGEDASRFHMERALRRWKSVKRKSTAAVKAEKAKGVFDYFR